MRIGVEELPPERRTALAALFLDGMTGAEQLLAVGREVAGEGDEAVFLRVAAVATQMSKGDGGSGQVARALGALAVVVLDLQKNQP